MKRIILTAVYFGTWPKWFPAFLASCATNHDVDWLIITDCNTEGLGYPNIRFMRMGMDDFNRLASKSMGVPVRKQPYTHDDLRPAYGHFLGEFFSKYDFWGHVDVDVVWGRIRSFVTDELLDGCDILSSRQNAFAGHFTVYRNTEKVNTLYRRHQDWQTAMSDAGFHHFNEQGMGVFFKYCLPKDLVGMIRVEWSRPLVLEWWPLTRRRRGWEWREGRLFDGTGEEHMYIHFMTWKPYMQHIDFQAGERPTSFRVTQGGIWSQPMGLADKIREWFPFRFLARSYLRYVAWYWVDSSRWLRFLRPGQHAKRDQPKV
jgi:hypothetical protein